MDTKRLYVDFHVLQTVPPSCVNRDDTGSPKTAVYGGAVRARVSSQAWKHAMRVMFTGEMSDAVETGYRTKKGTDLVAKQIKALAPDKDVRQAFLANAQSKVLLVEFDQEIAEKILDAAPKFGAAPHPVGSESKYEFAPMIYRVSGTFRAQDPTIEHRMIRINPMRSGPDTIIRILRSCMEQVEEN